MPTESDTTKAPTKAQVVKELAATQERLADVQDQLNATEVDLELFEQAAEIGRDGRNVHQRMVAVMRRVPAIEKAAKNEDSGYGARSIDDVLNTLHRLMASEGLYVLPQATTGDTSYVQNLSTNERGKATTITDARITMHYLFASEDGSTCPASISMEGRDYGDKATSKANSNALKYLLIQTFLIPLEGEVDPDTETIEVHAPPAAPAGPPPVHPNVRARTAVLDAMGGDVDLAGLEWTKLCRNLDLDPEAHVADETTADLIVHQAKSLQAPVPVQAALDEIDDGGYG